MSYLNKKVTRQRILDKIKADRPGWIVIGPPTSESRKNFFGDFILMGFWNEVKLFLDDVWHLKFDALWVVFWLGLALCLFGAAIFGDIK